METTLEAVFEDGVLKPLKPLDLPEGAHVNLYVIEQGVPRQSDSPADLIAAIANLPKEEGPEFTARDHDIVLYGKSA
jgi:predicted DNA-binding antitoxin AbrB/MazE fold protein